MKLIGTIKHNHQPGRVKLYAVEGSPNVHVIDSDGDKHDTEVPVTLASWAWSAKEWDFQPKIEPNANAASKP